VEGLIRPEPLKLPTAARIRAHRVGLVARQLTSNRLKPQLKTVEVICTERRNKDVANVVIIPSVPQLLNGAPNREVIGKNATLLNKTLTDPANLSEFEVAKVPHSNADPAAQQSQHHSDHTCMRRKEKKAEQTKDC